MAMKCAQCGTRLTPGTRSCPGCGQQFATEVPPDPAPAPQAQSPPASPPFGQAQFGQPPPGQYGQPAPPAFGQPPPAQSPYGQPPPAPPQYGQPPQTPPAFGQPQGPGQPYGQPQNGAAPQYGQPQQGQYGQPPVNTQKKSYPWIGATVVIVLGIVRVLSHLGASHSSSPTTTPTSTPAVTSPAQPAVTDNSALAANMKTVGGLRDAFVSINEHPLPSDADWKAKMEQNARDLKAASDQGVQYTWPEKYQAAQAPYRTALTDYSYVCARWPAAVEGGDRAATQDCMTRFNAGDAGLKQVLAALDDGAKPGQQSLGGGLSAPPKKSE